MVRPATPHAQRSWPYMHMVWAVPRSLATTSGVANCFPFLQVLRCFNSLGWLRRPMNSAGDHRGLPGGVAPFGDPRVSLHSSKPWLFAGSYVLHRLSVPRHPPHALPNLVKKMTRSVRHRRDVRAFPDEYSSRYSYVLYVTLAFNCQRSLRLPPRNPVRVHRARAGGDDRDRTGDLRLAKPALSRLSYIPGAARATPAFSKWWA